MNNASVNMATQSFLAFAGPASTCQALKRDETTKN